MNANIQINIGDKDMSISYGMDNYYYNLEHDSIKNCILKFLNSSGIEENDCGRVASINESNELLVQQNKELTRLLDTSLELNSKTREYNIQLEKLLLYTWYKK